MSDTYTQPKVDFIHNQIPNKLQSIRSLLEGEYASAAQSPDHETGPWSPEKQTHVEAIADAIAHLDRVSRALDAANYGALARMQAADAVAEKKEQEQLAAMEHGTTGRNDAAGSPLGQAGYCPHCLKDYGSGHHCCDC